MWTTQNTTWGTIVKQGGGQREACCPPRTDTIFAYFESQTGFAINTTSEEGGGVEMYAKSRTLLYRGTGYKLHDDKTTSRPMVINA